MSIYSSEHYDNKLERNVNIVDKVPEFMRNEFISHIDWAKDLKDRFDSMDFDQRDSSIADMIRILDTDYVKAGFKLEEQKEETKVPKM